MTVSIPGYKHYAIDTATGEVFSMAKSRKGVRLTVRRDGKVHLQKINGGEAFVSPVELLALVKRTRKEDPSDEQCNIADLTETRTAVLRKKIAMLERQLKDARQKAQRPEKPCPSKDKTHANACKDCAYRLSAQENGHSVLLDKLEDFAARLIASRAECFRLSKMLRTTTAPKSRPRTTMNIVAGVNSDWES